MKRVVGLILLALGVMMLVLAPLLKFYVLPSAAKTPVDQFTESTSNVVFEQLLDPALVAKADPDPYKRGVEATQYVYVRGDVPAAEQPEAKSEDLAVFDYFQRVNDNATGDLITAGTARYAFDRVSFGTAELLWCERRRRTGRHDGQHPAREVPVRRAAAGLPGVQHLAEGSADGDVPGRGGEVRDQHLRVQVRGPAHHGRRTRGPDRRAARGEEERRGQHASSTRCTPWSRTYWVDPVTGQIVAGESTENTTFDLDGEQKLVKAIYTGTNGTQESADDIAALANQVKLIGSTLPLVLGVLGIVLLVVGLLMLRGGKQDSGDGGSDEDLVPAGNAPSSNTATQVLDDATKKPDTT